MKLKSALLAIAAILVLAPCLRSQIIPQSDAVIFQNYPPVNPCTLPNQLVRVTIGTSAGLYQCIVPTGQPSGTWQKYAFTLGDLTSLNLNSVVTGLLGLPIPNFPSSGTGCLLYTHSTNAFTWATSCGGSGTFTTLTGDATSTSTGGATTVIGINNTLLSSLATGILKNTTSTGVPSIAASSDIIALFTGSCSSSTYLNGAGGCTTPSGSGTVTSFSAGALSPLFTTSVATATSTPALTFTLSSAAQNSVFAGPASGGSGAPSYQTAPTFSAANLTNFPTFNQNTTGNAGTATTLSTNGTANQIWGMNSGGSAQGWQNAPSNGISGGTSGQLAVFGSASTITSGIAVGNSGSDIPQLSSGLLNNSVVNWASPSAIGTGTPAAGTFSSVTLPGDGTHAAQMGFYPNTTVPTLYTGDFSILGPNASSVTQFAWQAPTAYNSSAGILHIGAGASAGGGEVSQMTISPVVGGDMTNNTVTATQLAAQYSKGSCTEAWSGSGTSSALTSGDDAISNNTCYNDSGVTRTITAVKCRNDNASNTTTVNPTFGSAGTGTTILSAAITCGSSYAYSSSGTVSNASWTTGTGIDPGMGGTLTGTSIAVIVEYTF